MNRTVTFLTALGAGLTLVPLSSAQTPANSAPAPSTPSASATSVTPQALAAKVALVNFEQVVLASNEGQVITAATQKKYEPKKAQIETLAGEVDSLKKGLQAAPTTLSDEERASRLRAIDTKEKQLNRDAEDAQTAYNAEWQEALSKVAQKIAASMKTYAQQSGFTMLLDVSSQQSNVLWALPSTDISQAVVDTYNKQSGVAAPPPSSPSTPRAARPAGASVTPRSTTPRPTAPRSTGTGAGTPATPGK